MDTDLAPQERLQIASLSDLFTASLLETLRAIALAFDTPSKTRVQAWQILLTMGLDIDAVAQETTTPP